MQGPEFVLFSPSHLWTIAIIVMVSALVPLWVRRTGSEKLADRLAKGLAAFVILHELVKTWVLVAVYDQPLVYHLPLHLCSIAILLTAVTLTWRNYRAYELVYFWGFAGTFLAVLTPDIMYGFPHIFYLSYFVSHGAIVFGALYATVVFRFRPTWRSIPRVYLTTLIYSFAIVLPLNYLLDTNYLYLRQKPAGASILDYLGPWPWYIVALLFLAWVFFLFYYVPFWIYDLVTGRRISREASTTA